MSEILINFTQEEIDALYLQLDYDIDMCDESPRYRTMMNILEKLKPHTKEA